MPVRFVIGRAGSGKTRRCVSEISHALKADPLGPLIYWIVPKQATFTAERTLTAAAGAFCRVRVLSFDLLGREIFACAGGNVIPEVTPLGRQMVIGRLLRKHQPQLTYFASSARQPGLAAELDAAFAEFERSGKTTADLATLIDDLEQTGPIETDRESLVAKLRDIKLLYDEYAKFIGSDRLDQNQRLWQTLRCIDDCPPLRGATVYVDGFAEFNDHQRRLLSGIAKVAKHVEVMLLMDPASVVAADPHMLPDETGLFHQTETTFRKLWFTFVKDNVPIGETIRLGTPARFANVELARIEREVFSDTTTSSATAPPLETVAEDLAQSTQRHRAHREEDIDSAPSSLCDLGASVCSVLDSPQGGSVELILAPDREAEVNAVARRIRKLWREDGHRLREIAVLARDVEPYHTLIDASFREHGISYFVDRRRSAAHHPLLLFVRSALRIARHDWPNESAIALLKSGLAGVTPDEADEVENYVDSHRIKSGAIAWDREEPWAYRRKTAATSTDDPDAEIDLAVEEKPEAIDTIRRRLAELMRPMTTILWASETLTVRAIATELFQLLDRFQIRETLAKWSADTPDPEQAAEHEQVWSEFVSLCDQMVDLLGDESVTLHEFIEVLEAGLEQFDLALTPPTVDQVLVGAVDRARCPELKTVFVLGLNEGEFPRVGREASVLTDVDRRELRRRNVELDRDRRRQLHDEDLLGYIAFTRASQRLIASRSRAEESGKPTSPSRFWQKLIEVVPDAETIEIPRDTRDNPQFIETPRQVVVGLMRWARSSSPSPGTPGEGRGEGSSSSIEAKDPHPRPLPAYRERESGVWPALYQWLAAYTRHDDAIGRMRDLAWPAVGYANDAKLSPATAAQLFGTPLEGSARQLETFAACPFQHFARYGLALAPKRTRGVTGMDLSRVYHQVLDIVVGEVLEQRIDLQQMDEVASRKMIHQFSEAVGQQIRGELMLSTARNKYLLDRVERTLEEVVATQAETAKRGTFRPSHARVEFGKTGRLPALRVETPAGTTVLLNGSIDRVDALPDGQHITAFDYKLSAGALSLNDVRHGLSLQLLTHLLVLQASGQELAGTPLTPVAAFYVPLLRRLGDVDHPDDALDPENPKFHLRAKPRGVFNAEFLPGFDRELADGASDVVAAYVKKDGSLGNRGRTDVADPAEFEALLKFVRRRIGEIADDLLSGRVDVMPYRIGTETPCPRCEFRSVCRFEPSINRYHTLQPMGREEVLANLVGEQPGG